MGLLGGIDSFGVGLRNVLDDKIDIVVVFGCFGLRWRLLEVMLLSVVVDVFDKFSSLTMPGVVLGLLLVRAKYLDCGGASDIVSLSQIAILHHINCSKLDFLVS